MNATNRRLLGMASLFEQLVRATYDKRGPTELQPAQWSALRYFERAGQRARTVSGLAKFMGVTMGPASRAAKALEGRGLLASQRDPNDARSLIFTLTPLGQGSLKSDPLKRLADALSDLTPDELGTMTRLLLELTEKLGSDDKADTSD